MICAIVLAAGRSRRMGVQKLLLPVAGQPLICRAVDAVLAGAIEHVLVVTGGTRREELAAALADRPVHWVTNPVDDSEMIDSVRCGLAALPAECEAFLIVLGDQPEIPPDAIRRLVDAFRQRGAGIAVPVVGSRRGHPILIAARYRAEILENYGDVGLRGLLQAHPDDIAEVDVASPGVLEDIDCPADYQRVIARTNAGIAPGPATNAGR